MVGTSFGSVELTDGAKELYMTSGITKLQEYYGLSFNDLFDDEILEQKDVSEDDMKYILEHRETEFARREKEAWEMRANLFKTPEWAKLKAYYGLNEQDIRNVKVLESKGLKKEEIEFIVGRKLDKKPKTTTPKAEVKKDEIKEDKKSVAKTKKEEKETPKEEIKDEIIEDKKEEILDNTVAEVKEELETPKDEKEEIKDDTKDSKTDTEEVNEDPFA